MIVVYDISISIFVPLFRSEDIDADKQQKMCTRMDELEVRPVVNNSDFVICSNPTNFCQVNAVKLT